MQARGPFPPHSQVSFLKCRHLAAFYTLNKCFLITSVGPQVFPPEPPSRQLRPRGSEPGNDPSDEMDPDSDSGHEAAH